MRLRFRFRLTLTLTLFVMGAEHIKGSGAKRSACGTWLAPGEPLKTTLESG